MRIVFTILKIREKENSSRSSVAKKWAVTNDFPTDGRKFGHNYCNQGSHDLGSFLVENQGMRIKKNESEQVPSFVQKEGHIPVGCIINVRPP